MPRREISLEGLPTFDIKVHASGDQYIAADILRDGVWEPFETQVIRRCLDSNSDFYDIGANIGWYSLVMGLQLAAAGGTVHAFEPSRENAALLIHNIIANRLSNVSVSPCALGDSVRDIEMHLSSTNKGDHRAYPCEDGRQIEPGSMTRFDRYYTPTNRTPFVKIDTQGSELAVIEGMGDHLLSIDGLAMLIEFWPAGLSQHSDGVARLLHILQEAQFEPIIVAEGDPVARPTTWRRIEAAAQSSLAPETGYFVNLLLHRKDSGMIDKLSGMVDDGPSLYVPHI